MRPLRRSATNRRTGTRTRRAYEAQEVTMATVIDDQLHEALVRSVASPDRDQRVEYARAMTAVMRAEQACQLIEQARSEAAATYGAHHRAVLLLREAEVAARKAAAEAKAASRALLRVRATPP